MIKLPFGGKKKDVLGLDIGSKLTKLVRIGKSDKGDQITFCDALDFGRMDNQFDQKLKDYVSRFGLSGMTAAATLDDSSFKIRKVELPKMPDADLHEAVKWKMRDVVEGNIEDYSIRSSILSPSPDGKRMTLIGYAVKKSAVTGLIASLAKAGLSLQFVEPTAVSLATAMLTQVAGGQEWIAGIDIGLTKSLLVIVGEGHFYFSRPLVGINLGVASIEGQAFNQKLAAEIQNSLDTFAVTFHVEQISRIFLSGGGGLIPDLPEYLTQNLGVSSALLNPFEGLKVDKATQEKFSAKAPLFSQAVAMAKVII